MIPFTSFRLGLDFGIDRFADVVECGDCFLNFVGTSFFSEPWPRRRRLPLPPPLHLHHLPRGVWITHLLTFTCPPSLWTFSCSPPARWSATRACSSSISRLTNCGCWARICSCSSALTKTSSSLPPVSLSRTSLLFPLASPILSKSSPLVHLMPIINFLVCMFKTTPPPFSPPLNSFFSPDM